MNLLNKLSLNESRVQVNKKKKIEEKLVYFISI
jgi:hypothetical protein